MRQRPKMLSLFALVLAGIALSVPIQIMFLFGDMPTTIGPILSKITPMNWAVMVLAVVHAFFVFNPSKMVLLTSTLFVAAVGWNNFLVASAQMNYSATLATIGALVVVAMHSILLTKEVRLAIMNPRVRWWRTEPRRIVHVRAVVSPTMGGELSALTFDLSSGGAFFPITDSDGVSVTPRVLKNLRVGSRCAILLMLDQIHMVKCFAEVVRNTNSKGNYPSGFGVRFVNMESGQKKILSSFLSMRPQPPSNPVMGANA
ncbi:MAG: PilZ domain-containing protein [Bdellovibrionota bacterium]